MALFYCEEGCYRRFHLIQWPFIQAFNCTPDGDMRFILTSSAVIAFKTVTDEERDTIADRCNRHLLGPLPVQQKTINMSYIDSCGGRIVVRDIIAVSGFENRKIVFYPRKGKHIAWQLPTEAEVWTVMQRCSAEVEKHVDMVHKSPTAVSTFSMFVDDIESDTEDFLDCPTTPGVGLNVYEDDDVDMQACQNSERVGFLPDIPLFRQIV